MDGEQKPMSTSSKRPALSATHIIVFLIAIVVAFIAGTRSDYILASLMRGKPAGGALDLAGVQSLYRQLNAKYDGRLDTNKLVEGAKHGMVEAVGDPYTVYFTAEEKKQFLDDMEGTFNGIGAELGKKDNQLTIISTIDNSPAAKSGLRGGDVIAKVNDEDSVSWAVEKAVSKIRGEKGTTVKLTIVRASEQKPFDVSVVRDTITDPSVKYEMLEGNIGLIRITRFGQTDTASLARQAAERFKDQQVKGIVLDLRGNGGGYLVAAQEIASLWMKDKTVVTQRAGGKVVDTLKTTGDAPLEGVKTVVLINEGSASASEILAGALHDNNAAQLVGEKTFGKGVVQDMVDTSDGGSLKVTIAKWYTPKGKNISKEGIEPDVKISLSDQDYQTGADPQKDKALELLR